MRILYEVNNPMNAKTDQIKGRVEEAAGILTNDRRLKSSPDVIAIPSAPPSFASEGAPERSPSLCRAARAPTRLTS